MLRIGLVLLPLLLAGAATQERSFAAQIDAEVRSISGFNQPTPVCDDGLFLRRVMLDLVGFPPSAAEVRAFAADPSPGKRGAKVDQLLATERHADFWARRWMEVFFGNYHVQRLEPLKSLDPDDAARLMESFRRWLKERLHRDVPWTDVVRDLLEAEGPAVEVPAVVYKLGTAGWPRRPYYENRVSAHFLGMDLSCTGCHDSAFDKWRVDDGYAMMAFSTARTISRGPRGLEVREGENGPDRFVRMPTLAGSKDAQVRLGPDRDVARPLFFLGGKPGPSEVLARAFARFVTEPKNTQFRLAAVNRVWAWLLGRGLVSPVDDFNLKNKPLSRNLLTLLASEFAANRHSFRTLIRAICCSDTYQRRCDNPNPATKVTFAFGVVRPLSAEQILNSIETATRGRATFDVVRAQKLSELMLRGDAPGCEVTEARVDARALLWIANGDEVWSLIRDGAVMAELRKAGDPISAMFQAALSREPDAEEVERYGAFLQGREADGLVDAYWTLINSAEFLTRH